VEERQKNTEVTNSYL